MSIMSSGSRLVPPLAFASGGPYEWRDVLEVNIRSRYNFIRWSWLSIMCNNNMFSLSADPVITHSAGCFTLKTANLGDTATTWHRTSDTTRPLSLRLRA
jgi:hypothetical protein